MMGQFLAPVAIARTPGDSRSLWRRIFMQAVGDADASDSEVEQALYATALLSGTPLIQLIDGLVEIGLRAPLEAFPKPWLAVMRGRVLDLAAREMMGFAERCLVATWGWLPYPVARAGMPPELDSELDPYGADLVSIFMTDLGQQPRFGYTPGQMRLALLKTAVGVGRPLAEVVTALIARGMSLPIEAVPPACRETLQQTATHTLVCEQLACWQSATQKVAEIIPLRRAR